MNAFREEFPDPSDFPYVVVGGIGTEPDAWAMADSYLLAATLLMDSWEGRKEPWMVCYPVLYLCRHALELYLKDVIPRREKPSHDLKPLIDDFRSILRSRLNEDVPQPLRRDLYTLAKIDPDGQSFRYVTTPQGQQKFVPGEYWVSFNELRTFVEVMRSGIAKAMSRLNS